MSESSASARLRLPRKGPLKLWQQGEFVEGTVGQRSVSVLSWNVLAPCYVEGPSSVRYAHVDSKNMLWDTRVELVIEELVEADADIVLMQEVMFTVFDQDLEPRLASLGYCCLMQDYKHRKEGHPTANVTCFKEERFDVAWQEHRSRVLLVGLRDRLGIGVELCIANAHFEGDPKQPMARVRQAKSVLEQATKRGGQQAHALLLCGDFNAPLTSSAVASYLSFGAVLPGVCEFGREVSIPVDVAMETGHTYAMQSAYVPDESEFSFTLRGSAGPCLMLDQMWYDSGRVTCAAIRDVFRSPEHRSAVLACGLPNAIEPSDHMPVGAVFEILKTPQLVCGNNAAEAQQRIQNFSAEEVAQQADELWSNCPLSDVERAAWLAHEDAVSCATPVQGRKPTPEEINALQGAKEARNIFLASLATDAQSVLERITELRKQSRKAEQKAMKQRLKEAQDAQKTKNNAAHDDPAT